MPGAGTKTDITTSNPPPARVLDLTRLISRAGRVATGIDRVELAYLNCLLEQSTPCYALVRTRLGFVLLDRVGMQAIHDRINGVLPWGGPDMRSALARGYHLMRKRAEADLRRLCVARCSRFGLGAMLRRHLPLGVTYLNVGHSNLTRRVVAAMRGAPRARITVLLHDTIPLDFPQFQRPDTVEKFRRFLRLVSDQADLVICNSLDTQNAMQRIMHGWGRVPPSIVSHLGTIAVSSQPAKPPSDLGLAADYFVIVGTVEPRKNHAFLLDLWQELAREYPQGQLPQLVICGTRGWNNQAVFARLDDLAAGEGAVLELSGLSDEILAAVMSGARGALFPSFAEGFGLPATEAVLAGIPLVCNDLPVFGEFLGDIPIYASVSDSYLWKTTIMGLAQKQRPARGTGNCQRPEVTLPTWEDHFNVVLKKT